MLVALGHDATKALSAAEQDMGRADGDHDPGRLHVRASWRQFVEQPESRWGEHATHLCSFPARCAVAIGGAVTVGGAVAIGTAVTVGRASPAAAIVGPHNPSTIEQPGAR